jgi:hypothetical protein
MWTEQYHESITIGGLNYISFAIGLILRANIAGPFDDYVYKRLKASAVFGSVVAFTLWFFGERLRACSPYCAALGED